MCKLTVGMSLSLEIIPLICLLVHFYFACSNTFPRIILKQNQHNKLHIKWKKWNLCKNISERKTVGAIAHWNEGTDFRILQHRLTILTKDNFVNSLISNEKLANI